MDGYIYGILGALGTAGVISWGYLGYSCLRRTKGMTFNIPDLNASALVNGFKSPGVLLALADMIFMIVTKLLNLDISVTEYMAVASPVIAVISGQSVSDIAKYIAASKVTSETGTKTGGTNT